MENLFFLKEKDEKNETYYSAERSYLEEILGVDDKSELLEEVAGLFYEALDSDFANYDVKGEYAFVYNANHDLPLYRIFFDSIDSSRVKIHINSKYESLANKLLGTVDFQLSEQLDAKCAVDTERGSKQSPACSKLKHYSKSPDSDSNDRSVA